MNTKLPVSRIQCEPDRTYNKADDMHLRASIKSRLDKGLKPLLQPVALKKLENNPDYDYAVDDGRRRFLALLDFKFTELELGQDAILIDGDSEINAYLANQHTNLSLFHAGKIPDAGRPRRGDRPLSELGGAPAQSAESFRTLEEGDGGQDLRLYDGFALRNDRDISTGNSG